MGKTNTTDRSNEEWTDMGTQDQRDRAHEWVGIEYPGDEGDAWEAAFIAALREIIALDAAEDAAFAAPAPVSTERRPLYDGAMRYLGTVAL